MIQAIAVTGATGFIGGAVARTLSASGFCVHAFGRRTPEEVESDFAGPYRSWDIARGPLVDAPKVDAVIHCAGIVDDWGRPAGFERVNVQGTANVLESWPNTRFVHVSSSSVYDPHGDLRCVQEDAADPLDDAAVDRIRWLGHYGRTKRLAETVVARARPNDSIILRPRAVYGPGDRTLLPRLLRRYRAGRLIVAGNPETRVSVTHIENFTSAVLAALKSTLNGAFNVVDEEPIRLSNLLEAALVAVGRNPRVVYLPLRPVWYFAAIAEAVHLYGLLPPPIVTRFQLQHLRGDFVLDSTRARRELGWHPVVNTLDGIRMLAESPICEQ